MEARPEIPFAEAGWRCESRCGVDASVDGGIHLESVSEREGIMHRDGRGKRMETVRMFSDRVYRRGRTRRVAVRKRAGARREHRDEKHM